MQANAPHSRAPAQDLHLPRSRTEFPEDFPLKNSPRAVALPAVVLYMLVKFWADKGRDPDEAGCLQSRTVFGQPFRCFGQFFW